MKVLLIGATGFIGRHVVRDLLRTGHHVTVFHRGSAPPPQGADEILGDHIRLHDARERFRALKPDVVIDFILSNGTQAEQTIDTLHGAAKRLVAISSGDVYRACGIMHGFETGPLQPVPLIEESELRTTRNVYGQEALKRLRGVFSWLADEYDKIPVEQAVLSGAELQGTVLRLPMVYGPGDPLHRLFPYLKRMDDKRREILLQEGAAHWRGPRGYVENVAAAIALATVSDQAAGRVYNIADAETFSELDWIAQIGRVAGWNGTVMALPKDALPVHLRIPYRSEQHWEMSSARIRNELGYEEPVDLDTGLKRTIDWERATPPALDPNQFDYAAEDAALRTRMPVAPT